MILVSFQTAYRVYFANTKNDASHTLVFGAVRKKDIKAKAAHAKASFLLWAGAGPISGPVGPLCLSFYGEGISCRFISGTHQNSSSSISHPRASSGCLRSVFFFFFLHLPEKDDSRKLNVFFSFFFFLFYFASHKLRQLRRGAGGPLPLSVF